MLAGELLKIWGEKKRKIIYFLIILTNIAYLYYYAYSSNQKPVAYREITKDLGTKEISIEIEKLEKKIENIREIYGDFDSEKDILNYVKSERVYKSVINELKDVYKYPDYLESVRNSASKYNSVSFFSGFDERLYKKFEYSEKVYKKVKFDNIIYTKTKGFCYGLTSQSTILFGVVLSIMFGISLFIDERRDGISNLIRTNKYGRRHNIIVKEVAVLISILISEFVLFSTSIVTGCFIFGRPVKNFLKASAASLYGFKSMPLNCNILEWLLMIYLLTCLVNFVISLLFVLIVLFVRNFICYTIGIFSFIGIDLYFYEQIANYSKWVLLKKMNIFYISNIPELFRKLDVVLVLDIPIGFSLLVIITAVVSLIVFTMIIVLVAEKTLLFVSLHREVKIIRENNFKNLFLHTNLLGHEIEKMFIKEGTAVILLFGIFVGMLCVNVKGESFDNISDIYYKSFVKEIEGPVNEKTFEILDNHQLEIDDMTSANSEKQAALDRAYDYACYIRNQEEGKIVYSKGYELLIGNNKQNIIMALVTVIIIVISSVNSLSTEYESGMDKLIKSSKSGIRKVIRYKIFLLLFCSGFVYCALYLRYLIKVLDIYGVSQIDAPINSIIGYKSVISISIYNCVVLTYLKKFLGIILTVFISLFITKKVKNYTMSMFACIGICLIPLLIGFVNYNVAKYVLLNYFFL